MSGFPLQFQSTSSAYATEGQAYAATLSATGTDAAEANAAATNYAAGASSFEGAYEGTAGDLTKLTASFGAILAAFNVLGTKNVSAGDAAKAVALLESGVAGLIVSTYAAAGAATAIGIVDLSAVVSVVPIVGLIVGAALLVVAVVVAIVAHFAATSNPPASPTAVQIATINVEKAIANLPAPSVGGAPVSKAAWQLSYLLGIYTDASYSPSACIPGGPSGHGFGIACTPSPNQVHALLAQAVGNDNGYADRLCHFLGTLRTDPGTGILPSAWGNDGNGGAWAPIDSSSSWYQLLQLGLTPSPWYAPGDQITNTTSVPTTPGGDYIAVACVALAQAALDPRYRDYAEGIALAVLVHRLVVMMWIAKSFQLDVPSEWNVQLGYTLSRISDYPLPVFPPVSTRDEAAAKGVIANAAEKNVSAMSATTHPLSYWVQFYGGNS